MRKAMTDEHRFEELLAGFTAGLSAAGPAELDQEIPRWLGHLGRYFGARNMGVGELVGTTTPFAHIWSPQGDVVPFDSMFHALPWSTARLNRGETIVLDGGLDGLPPEAEADRRAFEASGEHPDVMLPLMKDVERAHILEALEERGWKVSGPGGAAEALGLNESTLRSQMKRLRIHRPSNRRSRGRPTPSA